MLLERGETRGVLISMIAVFVRRQKAAHLERSALGFKLNLIGTAHAQRATISSVKTLCT